MTLLLSLALLSSPLIQMWVTRSCTERRAFICASATEAGGCDDGSQTEALPRVLVVAQMPDKTEGGWLPGCAQFTPALEGVVQVRFCVGVCTAVPGLLRVEISFLGPPPV